MKIMNPVENVIELAEILSTMLVEETLVLYIAVLGIINGLMARQGKE